MHYPAVLHAQQWLMCDLSRRLRCRWPKIPRSDFRYLVEKFLELNALLRRPLKSHIACRNRIQQGRQQVVRVVRPTCDEEMMEAVDHASSVQIVRGHHLIEGAHGAFENPGVLLPLTFPFPVMNSPSKGFFHDQLYLTAAAVRHQKLDVFSLTEQVALRQQLECKNGFSKIATGHVSDIAQHAGCWSQLLFNGDGLQALFDHQPGEGGHPNVLGPTPEGFNDSGGGVGREQEASASAALFHHAAQVGLASMAEVIGIFDDDDARHSSQCSRCWRRRFFSGGWR